MDSVGMGWVVYFSKNFRKLAVSTSYKGMFDETIILQRSLENSPALPNIDELLCDFSNSNRCLLSAANSLFTQLLCLAVLQCCCTVKRFSAVTFTSHNLQNKIFLSVLKYFSPNFLTKPALSHYQNTTLHTSWKLKLFSGTDSLATRSDTPLTPSHPTAMYHIPSKNRYLWPLFLRTESPIKFLANNGKHIVIFMSYDSMNDI